LISRGLGLGPLRPGHFGLGFGCSELFPPRNVTVMRKQSGTPKVHVSAAFWLRLIRVGPILTVDAYRR